jgi:hypothetical protein
MLVSAPRTRYAVRMIKFREYVHKHTNTIIIIFFGKLILTTSFKFDWLQARSLGGWRAFPV